MVEPTETESLETLDHFVEVMREIAEPAATDPDAVKRAPVTTPVGRLDEAAAARRPDLRYTVRRRGRWRRPRHRASRALRNADRLTRLRATSPVCIGVKVVV